jgi:transcriptional regulator with XRE-family HTH domain
VAPRCCEPSSSTGFIATPGLRREELAQLSGISVTWYTWLEQGRHISVSREVIESLARVLRMTAPEREHLFTVAGLALPGQTAGPPEVDDTLRRLVQTLDPNPAFVAGTWWDLLAYNQAYSFLHGSLDDRPPAERNVQWLFFATDPACHLVVNWPEEARQLVGQLRARLAQYPGDRQEDRVGPGRPRRGGERRRGRRPSRCARARRLVRRLQAARRPVRRAAGRQGDHRPDQRGRTG